MKNDSKSTSFSNIFFALVICISLACTVSSLSCGINPGPGSYTGVYLGAPDPAPDPGPALGPGPASATGAVFLLASLVAMNLPFSHKLSISCINCNSLNSSLGWNQNRNLKVNGITKLGSDIILLSDIRLGNKNLVSCADELKKLFSTNLYDSYDLYYNSTRSKRGVGMLIKKSLSIAVQDQRTDSEENFILLKTSVKGENLIIGSVYGPNNDDPRFFDKLKANINLLSNNTGTPVLLGGDWNCTYSVDPVEVNIDIYNMRALPNRGHSVILNQLCDELDLIDPFRLLHYNKIDFTYAPRSAALVNKSRIDFFLISGSLSRAVNSCNISPALQNKLFAAILVRHCKINYLTIRR
jgi:exonuclease III